MRRSRLPLLFAAILLPCAALATLGVASLAGEASQTEQRYRQRAEGALDTAVAAVEATAAALPRGVSGAVAFTATLSGELVDPAPASRPASRPSDGGASADLLLSVLTEVDRLERTGDLERAATRLREFTSSGVSSELAAAALTALGAIERKRGRNDEAQKAWDTIVSQHPDARDPRGLKRSFGARLALAETSDESTGGLVALFFNVVADDDGSSHATSAFRRDLRARIFAGARSPPAKLLVDQLVDRVDWGRAPARQLRAALDAGLRDWISSGGRGVRTFTVPGETRAAAEPSTDPVALVVAVRDGVDRITGGAAPRDAVLAAALARGEVRALEAVGFTVGVQEAGGKGPVPPRSTGERLGNVSLAVGGVDLEAFRAQERRRLLLTAGLAALALLVAAAAAFATVRAVRREQRAARDRENFVAAVTHELKAPLASIRLLAEVLARGGVEEHKVREFAERTIGECDRLGRLVGSVLQLARIEAEPAFVANLRTVDAGVLAGEVLRSFEPVARKHGFTVVLRIAEPGLAIAGDRDALAGAILNLLDNAVKYADLPGEIELEVAAAGRHHAAFSVLDRGRGVPAADARRIFEPFTRLGDEMTRDRPGVGLGLALVRRIAHAHGGTASCAPREGGGSRFTVMLPVAAGGAR